MTQVDVTDHTSPARVNVKVRPLSVLADDPYMTLPVTKDQLDALREQLILGRRFRQMQINFGITRDDNGNELTTATQEAMLSWLMAATKAGHNRMADDARAATEYDSGTMTDIQIQESPGGPPRYGRRPE